jgi:undecaprenol kinase
MNGRVQAFRYALRGLVLFAQREPNVRIHLALALAAVWGGWVVGLSHAGWAVLALTISTVFGFEAMNTAVERAVDLAQPAPDPRAGAAKDVAAAAVLLAAAGAAGVAAALFAPHVGRLWAAALSPRGLLLLVALGVLFLPVRRG